MVLGGGAVSLGDMDARVTSLLIYPESGAEGQSLDAVDFLETGPEGNRAKKHAVHIVSASEYVRTHPRANVVIDVSEQDLVELVGHTVKIGEALLRITKEPEQCSGVYAEVLEPGGVAVGDSLLVADA